jgi:hypothetical protein
VLTESKVIRAIPTDGVFLLSEIELIRVGSIAAYLDIS